jgi:hypothetical protein
MFFTLLGYLHAALWWLASAVASWKAEAIYLLVRGGRQLGKRLNHRDRNAVALEDGDQR